jgi:hypothetical protein
MKSYFCSIKSKELWNNDISIKDKYMIYQRKKYSPNVKSVIQISVFLTFT